EVAPSAEPLPLRTWVERIQALPDLEPGAQREAVAAFWRQLSRRELFLFIKMLTGELRVGVSNTLVVRALAQVTGLSAPTVAHRLMGNWEPTADFFRALTSPEAQGADASRPYPFFLASPLERPLEELGPPSNWLIEWKWDGIRGQLLRREGKVFLWSRGEELITDRFPEIRDAALAWLPDGTVIDGEVLAYRDRAPLRFSVLQRRIGRQKLTPGILTEAPVVFMAYDLLEDGGEDIREVPLRERRRRLAALLEGRASRFPLSPVVEGPSWEALAELRKQSRERNVEGFILKRLDSPYLTGRKRGDWWKWKIDPYSIDAVLVYAQPGNGRRATLLTDYTFAVWKEGELVPVAKAYSGLSDEELLEQDRWIRQHTKQRFGPVREVEPTRVFELHFEGIALSPRHKSGIAVRFPRIARWRTDKTADQADTLESVRALLEASRGAPGPDGSETGEASSEAPPEASPGEAHP
ncbi:MAG TPA: ATP-dependent DNA ligase, partial [Longimicrobium sp.]|nr:ATP-dependent DNA ligase [Longimicrobium sp.]